MIAAAGEKGSELASGGMITKIEAAVIAGEAGIPTVIIKGEQSVHCVEYIFAAYLVAEHIACGQNLCHRVVKSGFPQGNVL